MKSNKGKLFGIFNILDLFVVAVIVVVIVVGVKIFGGGSKGGDVQGTTYFTVELRPVKEDYLDKVQAGVEVKDSIKDNYLGVIESVEYEKDKLINWSAENEQFVESYSPEDYSMKVLIKANGSQTEADIFAENMAVKVGKDMAIKGKGFAHVGYIIEVEYVEGE